MCAFWWFKFEQNLLNIGGASEHIGEEGLTTTGDSLGNAPHLPYPGLC